jgi:WD40 repeat protein
LWDPATGTPVGDPLEARPGVVRALAVVPLPDGRTLLASGGDDGTVRLWDPATGTPVGSPLEGHTGWVRALAVAPLPDGRTLLASGGDDRTVRLWDPATGTPAAVMRLVGPVHSLAATYSLIVAGTGRNLAAFTHRPADT